MEASEPAEQKRPETGEFDATAEAPVALTPAGMPELAWTATQMRAEGRIVINGDLIAAYQAASSLHSIRALKSDLEVSPAKEGCKQHKLRKNNQIHQRYRSIQ